MSAYSPPFTAPPNAQRTQHPQNSLSLSSLASQIFSRPVLQTSLLVSGIRSILKPKILCRISTAQFHTTLKMPSTSRKSQNERIARQKAIHTHVYISSLKGHHTLEVGLAYYYRGHYIYAYPAGNLIEPIPYSTRKGIMIQGIVSASAPAYDPSAPGLQTESSVEALKKSMTSEREAEKQSTATKAADASSVLSTGGVTSSSPPLPLSSPPHSTADDPRPSLSSIALLRESALNAFTPRHGASFLAASAPGSRLASRAASPSGLRPISSHVGLARLGGIRGPAPPASRDPDEANSIAEDGSARETAVGYLVGLADHALAAADSRSSVTARGVRVAPCAIHGEECGGVATAEPWLTERSRRGKGFVEELPMVEGGGRVMVDWAKLLAEEKAGGGQ